MGDPTGTTGIVGVGADLIVLDAIEVGEGAPAYREVIAVGIVSVCKSEIGSPRHLPQAE